MWSTAIGLVGFGVYDCLCWLGVVDCICFDVGLVLKCWAHASATFIVVSFMLGCLLMVFGLHCLGLIWV